MHTAETHISLIERMSVTKSFAINLRGRLYSLEEPRVMGIVNVTPDSFYADSRTKTEADIERRVEMMLTQGADMLDLGGYSSRPGAAEVSVDEESRRLALGLKVVRRLAPEIPVSVDTFRSLVARRCVVDWDADIINDISGGLLDPQMASTVASLQVPAVVMHTRGTPATMQQLTHYAHPVADVLAELAMRVSEFRRAGVADVIADPGFGFAKTVEQNYQLMASLREFRALEAPLLVGISRKSMIFKPLNITPAESLPGTITLNMAALERGASILRVHDVAEAVQTVKIFKMLHTAE